MREASSRGFWIERRPPYGYNRVRSMMVRISRGCSAPWSTSMRRAGCSCWTPADMPYRLSI